MRLFLLALFFSQFTLAATEWPYFQVQEGDTLENIGLSLYGNSKLFKEKLSIRELPAVGKYFKFPSELVRLKCNVNYSPRRLKVAQGSEVVRLVTLKKRIESKKKLISFLKNNLNCVGNLRPWRNMQFISYVFSYDSYEEKNDDVATQTQSLSYAGVEFSLRREFGWVNPWVGSLRAKVVKGEATEGYSLGPQIDLEAGLGKVLVPNKQSLYFKFWRNQFDFVGETGSYIGAYTNRSNFLGLSYEYIWSINGRPWIGEAGVYWGLNSSFTPEVNGQKEDLSGYAARLKLKIPFSIGEYDQFFVAPSWQLLNFSATGYNLSNNQLSLSAGLRF